MLEGDGRLELPMSALPEAEPPALLLWPLSLTHVEQPHFSLAAPMQALVSVMVSFTAPEVLSSSNPKRDGVVKPQPCVLGSFLAAPWLLLRGLAKGARWKGMRLSSSLRLSPPASLFWADLAKEVPLWAGSVEKVLGQLRLSSLDKDLDQTSFLSNFSASEVSF